MQFERENNRNHRRIKLDGTAQKRTRKPLDRPNGESSNVRIFISKEKFKFSTISPEFQPKNKLLVLDHSNAE